MSTLAFAEDRTGAERYLLHFRDIATGAPSVSSAAAASSALPLRLRSASTRSMKLASSRSRSPA